MMGARGVGDGIDDEDEARHDEDSSGPVHLDIEGAALVFIGGDRNPGEHKGDSGEDGPDEEVGAP